MIKIKRTGMMITALVVSLLFESLCITLMNNRYVEAYAATTDMVTQKITVKFHEGNIDATKYLPKEIKAEDIERWTVNKKAIATVSETGIVTPVDFGSVNVYAKINNKNVFKLSVNLVSSNEGKAKPFSLNSDELFQNDFNFWLLDNLFIGYSLPEVLQEEIDSIEDVILYTGLSNFNYYAPFPVLVKNGWSNTAMFGAEGSLRSGSGVCEDIANVAVYLLQNDYDDIGVIAVMGNYGHMYNYILQDGIYYVFDLTQLISSSENFYKWYENALIWSGDNLADYSEKSIQYGTYLSDKRSYTEYIEVIIAISCSHFDFVPSQYRSNNWGSSYSNIKGYCYESKTNTHQYGLEEGIKTKLLYIDKTGDSGSKWEIISVPSKDIPYFGYSYFTTETIEEKYTRQITNKEGFLDPTGRLTKEYLSRSR